MFTSKEFFNLDEFDHADVFADDEPVWTALDRLGDFLERQFQKTWPLAGISGHIDKPIIICDGEIRNDLELSTAGPKNSVQVLQNGTILENASVILPGAYLFDDKIIIGHGVTIEPGALIKGPAIFGNGTDVRQGAYVRGNCLVGAQCVVGHATEIKNSIMLDGAQAGHFAYLGDSILGNKVNLGAGTKLANLKIVPGTVKVPFQGERHDTGRRKMGAVLGDGTQTGCNSVTSPGTLVGPGTAIYPCVVVPPGYHPGRPTFKPAKGSVQTHSRPDSA